MRARFTLPLLFLIALSVAGLALADQLSDPFWFEDFEDASFEGWKVKPGYEAATFMEIDSTLTYDSRYCLLVTSTFSNPENTTDWTAVVYDFEENGLPLIRVTDSTIVYWEWRIADVYVTRSVKLGLSFSHFPRPVVTWASHNFYTARGPKAPYWDEEGVWYSHRENILENFIELGWEKALKARGLKLEELEIKSLILLIDSTELEKVWLDNIYIGPSQLLPRKGIKPPSKVKELSTVSLSNQQYSTAAALGDVDNDGDLDLYVVNRRQVNRLYLNDGRGNFDRDITFKAAVADDGAGTGAVFADLDNDGDKDLLITNEYGVNRAFRNTGRGVFEEISHQAGIDTLEGDWYGVALSDVDGDGFLDPFFANSTGSNLFLMNDGYNFSDISNTVNDSLIFQKPGMGMTYGSTIGDVDDDGDADLFITNTHLFENKGGFIFNGVTYRLQWPVELERTCHNEGGIFGDVDNDGDLDLYLAIDPWVPDNELRKPHNNLLFLNDGLGNFENVTRRAGVGDQNHSEAALFADLNNDGWLDIYVANREGENSFYRNNGDGTFANVIIGSGFEDCGHIDGVVCGDIDDDGDMDILLIDYFRGILIKENHTDNSDFLKVRLIGTRSNPDGVGAKVRIYDPGYLGESKYLRGFRECQVTQGFGPSSASEIHFGLGDLERVDVEVIFPSGLKEVRKAIQRGQTIYVVESPSPLHRALIAPCLILGRQSVHRTLMRINSPLIYFLVLLFGLAAGYAIQHLKRVKTFFVLSAVIFTLLVFYLFWGFGAWNGFPFLGVAFIALGTGIWNPRLSYFRRGDIESNRERLLSALREFEHSGAATRNLNRIGLFAKNLVRDGIVVPEVEERLKGAVDDYFQFTSVAVSRISELATGSGLRAHLSRGLTKIHRRVNKDLSDLLQNPASTGQLEGRLDEIQTQIRAIQKELDRFYSTDIFEAIQYVLNAHSKALSGVKVSISPSDPATLPWQRGRISHTELEFVLENLVSNSLKAMEPMACKEVHFSIRADERWIYLEVGDTGRGIPEERRETIFQPGGGHYGLPHSRQILDKYGGRIYVKQSSPDSGTTMAVEFKIAGKA